MKKTTQHTEGFISQAHLPEYLDISKSTVDRWLKRGKLPPSATETSPKLWRKNDLELWGEWDGCSQVEFIERKKALTTI